MSHCAVAFILSSILSMSYEAQSTFVDPDVSVPQNTAVVEKSSVTLPCRMLQGRSELVINWIHYKNAQSFMREASRAIIFNGRESSDSRFSFNITKDQCDLIIKSARSLHAGFYVCEVHQQGYGKRAQYSAHLTVLASKPHCSIHPNETDHLVGDRVAMRCTVKYNGAWSPVMRWKSFNGKLITEAEIFNSTTNVTSNVSHSVEVGSHDNGFICTTLFEENHSMNISHFGLARNVPIYSYEWETPLLKVYYGPCNVTVFPLQDIYHPGDLLNCSAIGNPQPSYEWIDEETNKVYPGQQFTITEAMVNSRTHRFKCRATNYVERRNITWSGSYEILFLVQRPDFLRTILMVAGFLLGDVVLVFVVILCFMFCKKKRLESQKEKKNPVLPHVYAEIELPPSSTSDDTSEQNPDGDDTNVLRVSSHPDSITYAGLNSRCASISHTYIRAEETQSENAFVKFGVCCCAAQD